MKNKYLDITALTKYLKYKFDSDEHLKKIYLKGEISNLKIHSTGHLYLSLKDESSKINAIMFNVNAKKLLFVPTDGMKVLVTGRISIYEATGNYQIYIDEMIEDGIGNLYIAFEQLKEKLKKEGLFDSSIKKGIPKIPNKIGIVTAPTGAAIKDIISTIKRRFPICETILFPSLVQGENAALDIANNIKLANSYDIDVLIVGRGGGSIEDLWPFNEEIVARAIFESNIPIVSAVGHEIDFTIADYVADLRAPTPTGAAEMVVPNISDIINYVNQLKIRLNENIYKKLNYTKLYLESIQNSYVIKNPLIMYENRKQQLDIILEKINNLVVNKISNFNIKLEFLKNNYLLNNPSNLYKNEFNKLNNIIEKLEILNPLAVLKRGFNITYKSNKIISSIVDIKKEDILKLKLVDGMLKVKVIEIEVENGKRNEI